ncbi:MAG: hypothetical protein JRN26_01440 [Nitrososphaerota archaeon]|jgi:hypothetical protein|nr:hypothetical protein [Nitrososphaerota archaeon]MDG6932188.1 hypothetical protein [Nitrososphaerota archaeon]MDG6935542.1 hypothetical protein [Nitrososphaerota archaeon]MDG6943513.1 hypothetical protein [Nitrososphaerota archaeon]
MTGAQQESEQNMHFACKTSAPVPAVSRISDFSHVEMGERKPMGLKKTQNARSGNDLYAFMEGNFQGEQVGFIEAGRGAP